MLSVFPSLLSWSQISPLLIRVTLGAVFIFWSCRGLFGKEKVTSSTMKILAVVEGIIGILLIIGMWTQVAAMIAAIDLIVRLVERTVKKAFLTNGVNYYLILLVLALSLIVTGAGFLARDLPL